MGSVIINFLPFQNACAAAIMIFILYKQVDKKSKNTLQENMLGVVIYFKRKIEKKRWVNRNLMKSAINSINEQMLE